MRNVRSKHRMSGFTPLFDILIDEYDLLTAAVYGRVWRYCQMKDGLCYATVSKIAESVGTSYRTTLRRLATLCDDGYLIDLDPGLRNAPHRYKVTGKADLEHVSEIRARQTPSSARETDEGSSATESHTSSATESHTSSARDTDEYTEDTAIDTDADAAFSSEDYQEALAALLAIGFQPKADAERYARKHGTQALAWARYAASQNLGGGFVRNRLDAGDILQEAGGGPTGGPKMVRAVHPDTGKFSEPFDPRSNRGPVWSSGPAAPGGVYI